MSTQVGCGHLNQHLTWEVNFSLQLVVMEMCGSFEVAMKAVLPWESVGWTEACLPVLVWVAKHTDLSGTISPSHGEYGCC